jgi:hypothetical protein
MVGPVPGQQDHFLINPYGLLFDEIGEALGQQHGRNRLSLRDMD